MNDEFYRKHNLKKSGEGPGGKFNGPSIKYILKDKVLNDLESKLPTHSIALEFTKYFKCIRELHLACTAKTLNLSETKRVIDNYTNQFYHLFMEYNLSMTLKVHIIIHHYQYFFTKSGQTMRLTNGDFVETCHSSLRKSEETHGFKVKKN